MKCERGREVGRARKRGSIKRESIYEKKGVFAEKILARSFSEYILERRRRTKT